VNVRWLRIARRDAWRQSNQFLAVHRWMNSQEPAPRSQTERRAGEWSSE
jgi:hypothetical protein